MREALPAIDAAGARLIGVVCQKRARVEAHFAAEPPPFPLLVDEDRSLARAWAVYHRIGIDALHIAHPASFVVDGSGIVRLAFVAPNQFTRLPVEKLVECLERLAR